MLDNDSNEPFHASACVIANCLGKELDETISKNWTWQDLNTIVQRPSHEVFLIAQKWDSEIISMMGFAKTWEPSLEKLREILNDFNVQFKKQSCTQSCC